ncbi:MULTISPECIES: hypothetical protein [Mesorhizobium]|uniref:hypothetical protein n=1 Tax=Mesorhizobium TaxID=68287 RepID=UPI0007A94F5B|nr:MULTISPECIES: hypothetical protein [Mesorhizobium]AMX93762.1 hypothetical protein A4R28_11925 [Mesorhizobium ciceri]MDF3208465.1 hypothetical protein [Mesorhizobium sp. LMG15046]MDF3228964.1 hypothetical protein [Mesorhizobium sp. DSM 30133]RUU22085.1 hypothetical protein EOC84_02955 [Mesorhizobium sp. Primo-B]RUU38005.1 hypothetical protein EOC83_17260 [Mesorhizobium sp. Primo-A]
MSVRTTATLTFGASITLNETEVRALEAMIGYGADAFLKVFKEKLGEHYIRDHQEGVRSFFKAVGRDVLPALRDIDEARKDLQKAAEKRAEAIKTAKEASA